jgi:transposase-like protein
MKYTQEQKDHILSSMLELNLSVSATRKRFGVSEPTLRSWLKQEPDPKPEQTASHRVQQVLEPGESSQALLELSRTVESLQTQVQNLEEKLAAQAENLEQKLEAQAQEFQQQLERQGKALGRRIQNLEPDVGYQEPREVHPLFRKK